MIRLDTQLSAYHKVMKDLRPRQYAIYKEIAFRGPISIQELALSLKTFPNRISGRFSELRKMNLIINKDPFGFLMRKVIDGSQHFLWRVVGQKEHEQMLKQIDQGQEEFTFKTLMRAAA